MDANAVANRVRDYEKTSGILWIVIGILQVISFVTIIAGVWNIYAGFTRIKLAGRIQSHQNWVVPTFERALNGIIIIAVINLIFGGVLGIAIAGFDYYIRDYVLKNKEAFI
jgi:uncharacterized membrane protein